MAQSGSTVQLDPSEVEIDQPKPQAAATASPVDLSPDDVEMDTAAAPAPAAAPATPTPASPILPQETAGQRLKAGYRRLHDAIFGGNQPAQPAAPATPAPQGGVGPAPVQDPRARLLHTVLRNSPVGYALESTMPKVADALDMHPTDTVHNPEYQQHREQLVSPEQLIPPAESLPDTTAGKVAAGARGVLKGAGGLTTPGNLTLMATGGILGEAAPILAEVPGLGKLLAGPGGARLVQGVASGAFTIDMLRGLYEQGGEFKKQIDENDTNGAMQTLGEMLTTGYFAYESGKHASKEIGHEYTVRRRAGNIRDIREARESAPPSPEVQEQPAGAVTASGEVQPAPAAAQYDFLNKPIQSGSRVTHTITDKAGKVRFIEPPIELSPDDVVVEGGSDAVRPGAPQVQAGNAPLVERPAGEEPQAGNRDNAQREEGSGGGQGGVPAEAQPRGDAAGLKPKQSRIQIAKKIDDVKAGKIAAAEIPSDLTKRFKVGVPSVQLDDGRRIAYNPKKTNEETIRDHASRNELHKLTGEAPPPEKVEAAKADITGESKLPVPLESDESKGATVPSSGTGNDEQLPGGVSGRTPSSDQSERTQEGVEQPEPVHKNASTQVNLPPHAAAAVKDAASAISENDLAGKGREAEPHVTVKYGVGDDAVDKLRDKLATVKPFEATLGKTRTFPPSENSDNAAVVHAEVHAPELHDLHKLIHDTAGNKADDFDYKPHVTLGYVKPEAAHKYHGRSDVEGVKFPVDKIAVSQRDGKQVEIPLGGKEEADDESFLYAGDFDEDQLHQMHGVLPSWIEPMEKAGALKLSHPEDWGLPSATYQITDPDKLESLKRQFSTTGTSSNTAIEGTLADSAQKSAPAAENGPTIDLSEDEVEHDTGTPRNTEDLPRVPALESEGGNARPGVSPDGEHPTQEGGDVRADDRPANTERVEHDGGSEGEGSQPARGGGGSPAGDTAAGGKRPRTRKPRPDGADGKPVESPVAEPAEEAKKTVQESRNLRNFRLTPEYREQIGKGGEISKLRDNLDALEILKKLQTEGREVATDEERAVLAKYVDFGGLVGMLEHPYDPKYRDHYSRYRDLLTQDEQNEIRDTLTNTHYTSMSVVDSIWKAIQRLGFKGGRVLEPGMGIGNFLGAMPEDISKRADIYGVEKNPLTGAMAKLLYPDANIQVKPFQKWQVPNNSLDLAIGNPPYHEAKVTDDPAYRDPKMALHNYFIVKTLDKLKPGGVAALITSRYTMDGTKVSAERAREEMAKRADLIGAIRLPDNAFKGNARTEVVADLLILKKRAPGEVSAEPPAWIKTEQTKVGESTFPINKYFVDHPEMVVGEHTDQGSMYRANSYTVKGPKDLQPALEAALSHLPENTYGKTKSKAYVPDPPPSTQDSLELAPDNVKAGAFFKDENGKVRVKQNGVGVDLPEDLRKPDKIAHIKAAIDLRDKLNEVMQTQLTSSDDADLKQGQKELGSLYDAYTKKYGDLHGPKLKAVFGDDPEYPKLLALENLDPDTKAVSKAKIFTTRVLAPPDPLRDLPTDPKAAMLKVMAHSGFLDTQKMAEILGKPHEEVVKSLEDAGLIFRDPAAGTFHPADEYLSGNVREKLKVAEAAAETDPRFQKNVEELKKVQPKALSIHEIQPNLGQTWIHDDIYKSFVRHLGNSRYGDVEISRNAAGRWLVQVDKNFDRLRADQKWGTQRVPAHKLVEYAMNLQSPTVWDRFSDGTRAVNQEATIAAREKLNMIKEEFRTVLRKAPEATVQKLETVYNDSFNGHRLREFNGEHLDFPGMAQEWSDKIRHYQKAAVWRILQEGRALLGHAVGLGKTLTMISSGMEAKRVGLSRKNMYAVPNHMIDQWREDFKRFYPNANVLAVKKSDFTAVNRGALMSRIATGDWDAVIVPHSQFDLLPMSPEWEQRTINKRLDEYRQVLEDLDPQDDRRTIKQIQKNVDKLESRLNDLNSGPRDNVINFDQLGVDQLYVDEAHYYKSMAVPTKMSGIKGIANSGVASKRALALEMKADYLRETHNGRGLIFATGTPITNTMGEIYVMTKYLAPDMLEAQGIRSFDDWAAAYANPVTNWEYGPDGVTFKPVTSLSEFSNVPELQTMTRRFGDFLSKANAALKEPVPNRKDVQVKVTPVQEPLLDEIASRGQRLMTDKSIDPREDNWLKLSSDARKISLDPRLYDPAYADVEDSKANRAVQNIVADLERTKKDKGATVVFSDFFQHKDGDGEPDFNLFHDMRDKLRKAGVPKDQIAIIHDFDTDEKKADLFNKVRSGKVRVLFGSTDKMGVGTNIQDRLAALHHLDQPWRPDQVEQREGRIIRNGNLYADDPQGVNIYRYISEPQEGKVLRYDENAKVPFAKFIGAKEKVPTFHDALTLEDGRRLAFVRKYADKNDIKRMIAEKGLDAVLAQTVSGGEVEADRPRAYDLQMYQALARKAGMIDEFFHGKMDSRTMEDAAGDVKLNAQMFQLAKAMATGNPDAMKKLKLENDMRTYQMLERNWQIERSKNTRQLGHYELMVPTLEKRIEGVSKQREIWKAADDGKNVSIQIGDRRIEGKDDVKKWLEANPDVAPYDGQTIKLYGMDIPIQSKIAYLNMKGDKGVKFDYQLAGEWHQVPEDDKGNTTMRSLISSVAARARNLDSHIAHDQSELEYSKRNAETLREGLKDTSPYAAKLEPMEKELLEINKRLGIVREGVDTDESGGADIEQDDNSGEAGFARLGSLPIMIPFHAARIVGDIYNRLVDAGLEKVQMGQPHPEIRQYDPALADAVLRMDGGLKYHKAEIESITKKIVGGLSREQEKGFVLMADQATREWLMDAHPDEYLDYSTDPMISRALQAYKPYEEALRDGVKQLGGKTIDEDYLHRAYDEYTSGINKKAGKANVGSGWDEYVTPQTDRMKGRVAGPDFYYEHGLHEFGPSFGPRWMSVMSKLDEHQAAVSFYSKATRLDPADPEPPFIYYNGQQFFSPEMAREIKQARPGSREAQALAAQLGISELPKPKEVNAYAVTSPFKGSRRENMGASLARTVLADGDKAKGIAAGLLKSYKARYAGPKEIVDTFEHAHQDALPTAFQRMMNMASPMTSFVRQQVIGFGLGIPHYFNILRRVANNVDYGRTPVNPVTWPSMWKVLFDKELKTRALSGIDDPAFDELLRHSGISVEGAEEFKRYVEGNLSNPKTWANAFKQQGREGGRVTVGSTLTAPFRMGRELATRYAEVGHRNLFKPGGVDQRSRLWLSDYLHDHDPSLSGAAVAQAVNDSLGRYNRTSWTELQRNVGPLMLFPGWDFSSASYVLRHPIRTALPPAIVIWLANRALHALGQNHDKDKNDPFYIHAGKWSFMTNLVREPMAARAAGVPLRTARALLDHKTLGESVGEGVSRLGSDVAGNTVGLLNPLLKVPLNLAANRKRIGGSEEIVHKGDARRRGAFLHYRGGKAVEDVAGELGRAAFPVYEKATDDNGGLLPSALSTVGVTAFEKKKGHRR